MGYQRISKEYYPISFIRWILATFVPVFLASWAHEKKSLSTTGALTAVLVGFILTLTNYSYLLSLLAFLITSGRAIKFKQDLKRGSVG